MAAQRIATQEDIDGLKIVSDPQVSPDGRQVAYVVSTTEGDLTRSNIWAASVDGGEPRQLSSGPRSDTAPRWSPDGETLAFLSDRAKDKADAVEFEKDPKYTGLYSVDVEAGDLRRVSPDGLQVWEFDR